MIQKIATLKGAKKAGYHLPKPAEYGGEETVVKGRVLVRNALQAVSATEWGRRGFRVLPGQEPHAWLAGQIAGRKRVEWPVYRHGQVVPKRKPGVPRPPQGIDILAAVWAVNRAAKRRRDAVQACYNGGAHAFAAAHKKKKGDYYDLKAQALHYQLAEGRLQVVGYHTFPGGLWAEVLKGDGYAFHRPCPPQQRQVEQLDGIEAKPRDRAEPRLTDALHTLAEYLADKPPVDCYRWAAPVHSRPSRWFEPDNEEDYDMDDDDRRWLD